MNRTTDLFDGRIADWLEDDPTQAPPQVLDTILAALPQISQRRSAPWALPRLVTTRRFGVALALLALGALLLAVATVIVGPPEPSPTTPTETTFTSPVYGYTVRYPADWSVVPGKRQLRADGLPCAECEEPDNFWVVSDEVAITIAASQLPAETTLDTWTATVTERIPAKFGAFIGPLTSQSAVSVGGESGILSVYVSQDATVLWITVVRGTEGWHLIWTDQPNVEPATIRPRLDAFLATFVFPTGTLTTAAPGPTGVPTASPSPAAEPIPDELIGAWHHPAPGWWWFLRAGDPECAQAVRTELDCVVWQRGTTPREIGIATFAGDDLKVTWRSGFCTSLTSTYSVALTGDSLNLVDIGGGCEGGNFALTRAGTGSAPTAPPPPAP
jgi:hypothetical protein